MENTDLYLGTGRLTWQAEERVSDRYGYVFLTSEKGNPVKIPAYPVGTYGQLLAHVIQVRPASHVGDWFHEVFPTTPDVGEVVTLGTGIYTYQTLISGITQFGLVPTDNRATLWLDIHALYRVIEQTVSLWFRPLPLKGDLA